jgi:hypothetical protein
MSSDKAVCCNKCGQSQMMGFENPDGSRFLDVYGLPPIVVSSGFLSRVFPDGMRYKFSLCEICLKILFDSFMIPPETFSE